MNNEEAWNALFEKYHIRECVERDGSYRIKADEIKEFREPRLMTKFDFRSQLPSAFRASQLSILPITRGDYIISDIKTFELLPDSSDISLTDKVIPSNIESLDFSSITSEAIAINCAYVSDILSDFIDGENLLPTVNSRMKSDAFSFNIERSRSGMAPLFVDVNNAQIEIDGGFEGESSLMLLEAKNKVCVDFMVRQLYYPYRKWTNKVHKKVRPVFFEYSNGIFHLREFEFQDLNNYNSLALIKQKKYRLRDAEVHINTQTLQELLQNTRIVPEPEDVPFPQADSFERVVSLCEVLYSRDEELFTKELLNYDMDFTGQDSFTSRQVDYYTNAAIYLGLVQKVETGKRDEPDWFVLTDEGKSALSTKSINERQLKYIKAIISHQAFARVLRLYFENAETPSKESIVEIMKDCQLRNMNTDGMFRRRASTVKSWIEWIIRSMDE